MRIVKAIGTLVLAALLTAAVAAQGKNERQRPGRIAAGLCILAAVAGPTMFLSAFLRDPRRRWALVNTDTGATLANRVEGAFDSQARRRGLLGRTGLDDEALVIAPCNAIHTCFMRFPIDVVFINREGSITRCHSHVPAWRIVMSYGFATIELAAGTLLRTETRRSQRLALVPSPDLAD